MSLATIRRWVLADDETHCRGIGSGAYLARS